MKKLFVLACALLGFSVQAQDTFPSRPIRFVTVASPGGGGDAIARMLADKMGPLIGGTFYVDNKPGAGGAIAADAVAKAPADGYTILLGSFTSHVLLPSVRAKMPYDSVKDFAPIGRIGTAPILLMAANDFPANNVKELVDLAKRSSNPLMYASWGVGSTGHFCGALLAQRTQIKWTHIPYKGIGPIQTDLLGGQLKLAYVDMATGSPMVKSGRVKAIASCIARSPSLPDVRGYEDDGIDFSGKSAVAPMWGVYAPAATPKPVLDKLVGALKQVIDMPDVRERLLGFGVSANFLTGDAYRQSLAEGITQWREIARLSEIVIE